MIHRPAIALLAFCYCCVAWHVTSLTAFAEEKPAPKAAASDLTGNWLGSLNVGVVKLRLGFILQAGPDGKAMGTLISIDQGATTIPLDGVEIVDGKVTLSVKIIQGSFTGELNDKRDTVTGVWRQGPTSLPLVLKKVDSLPSFQRPQEPKRPLPYREEQVTFINAKHNVTLNGTLTVPAGKGPFPAAVLITGSGPQNRDEELMGHKPFLVLSDALTRRGIAVLRFDDREFGKPAADVNKATSADLMEDVAAGVEFLRKRPDCDPHKIGLIGHSEGGLIAPMLAARAKDIAFVVMIAGPGLPGDEILISQSAEVLKLMGMKEEKVNRNSAAMKKMMPVIAQEKNDAVAIDKLRAILLESLDESEKKQLAAAKADADPQLQTLLTPWFRYFLAYDPRPALQKTQCPVLAVIGDKDCQVLAKGNIPAIEAALKEGGNKDFTVKELPGLNHLLQPAKTGLPAEYATIEQTMSPDALKLIGDWILERMAK